MGQIKTPAQIMYEQRLEEITKELAGLSPSFFIITCNEPLDHARLAYRGDGWFKVMPNLLLRNPSAKVMMTAAVLRAHLAPEPAPPHNDPGLN